MPRATPTANGIAYPQLLHCGRDFVGNSRSSASPTLIAYSSISLPVPLSVAPESGQEPEYARHREHLGHSVTPGPHPAKEIWPLYDEIHTWIFREINLCRGILQCLSMFNIGGTVFTEPAQAISVRFAGLNLLL